MADDLDIRVSRTVDDPAGNPVTISARVRDDIGAALRAVDSFVPDVAERCPGCRVKTGDDHLAGCYLLFPSEDDILDAIAHVKYEEERGG